VSSYKRDRPSHPDGGGASGCGESHRRGQQMARASGLI